MCQHVPGERSSPDGAARRRQLKAATTGIGLANTGHMLRRSVWIGLMTAFGASCAGTDADLPTGWEDAARIENLVQHDCQSSALAIDPPEGVRFAPGASQLEVTYDHAHFRCEQRVEGFVRQSKGTLELLVQPIEMDPSSVARCDCRYEIAIQLPVRSGSYAAKLYRRWDNVNDPNPAVEIGRAELTVP